MRWTSAILGVGVLGTLGCATTTPAVRVQSMASTDLGCREDVRITDASQGVYLVEGCGQIATYYCSGNHATLQTECERVTDADQVARKGNLADALDAQSKERAEQARPTDTTEPAAIAKQRGSAE